MIQIVYLNDENSLTHHGAKSSSTNKKSYSLSQRYKQKRLVKKMKKQNYGSAIYSENIDNKNNKRMKDIAYKHENMIANINIASDDIIKVDNYETAYDRRREKWAFKDLEKNHPDMYKEILADAKSGGFDPSQHKYVEMHAYGSNAYEKIEPYKPPITPKYEKAMTAIRDYNDAVTSYAKDLVGQYGSERITQNNRTKSAERWVYDYLDSEAVQNADFYLNESYKNRQDYAKKLFNNPEEVHKSRDDYRKKLIQMNGGN